MLSESVLKGLTSVWDDASETGYFAEMIDKFFDALNIHNYNHGARSRKSFQLPYTSGDDHRLKVNFTYTYLTITVLFLNRKFLLDKVVRTFLKYLEDWRLSVMQRPDFSKAQRNKMLLSDETQNGLQSKGHILLHCWDQFNVH